MKPWKNIWQSVILDLPLYSITLTLQFRGETRQWESKIEIYNRSTIKCFLTGFQGFSSKILKWWETWPFCQVMMISWRRGGITLCWFLVFWWSILVLCNHWRTHVCNIYLTSTEKSSWRSLVRQLIIMIINIYLSVTHFNIVILIEDPFLMIWKIETNNRGCIESKI